MKKLVGALLIAVASLSAIGCSASDEYDQRDEFVALMEGEMSSWDARVIHRDVCKIQREGGDYAEQYRYVVEYTTYEGSSADILLANIECEG